MRKSPEIAQNFFGACGGLPRNETSTLNILNYRRQQDVRTKLQSFFCACSALPRNKTPRPSDPQTPKHTHPPAAGIDQPTQPHLWWAQGRDTMKENQDRQTEPETETETKTKTKPPGTKTVYTLHLTCPKAQPFTTTALTCPKALTMHTRTEH